MELEVELEFEFGCNGADWLRLLKRETPTPESRTSPDRPHSTTVFVRQEPPGALRLSGALVL